MAKRFAAVGLIPKADALAGPTLQNFINDYITARSDIKPRSVNRLEAAGKKLVECFGPDRRMKEFTIGDADSFRLWLVGQAFAENTVRRLCGRAKQFFRAAVRRKLIPENPFGDLVSAVRGNPSRFYFVTQEEATKVLDSCPDAEWRLLFALSRYGGLRCPSEHLSMRWGDVDWANNRVRVPSPKTEHIEGKESRMIPMFPELKPYLEEAFEQAAPGTEFVINRYRSCNANLRTQLMRIIKRAGLKPWPKPFQNLRSTRETELMEKFPAHVVCGWIGNSEAIALKHYLQVTDDHFERAVRGEAEIGPEVAPTPTNPAAQKVAQHAHAGGSSEQHAAQTTNAKAPGLPGPATFCDIVNTCSVPPRGVEPRFSD
jgi:integrase